MEKVLSDFLLYASNEKATIIIEEKSAIDFENVNFTFIGLDLVIDNALAIQQGRYEARRSLVLKGISGEHRALIEGLMAINIGIVADDSQIISAFTIFHKDAPQA